MYVCRMNPPLHALGHTMNRSKKHRVIDFSFEIEVRRLALTDIEVQYSWF